MTTNLFSEHPRIKQIRISSGLMSEFCRLGWKIPNGNRLFIETVQGVPADAKYLRGGYDSIRDEFVLIFEHPSFEIVLPGNEIPSDYAQLQVTHVDISDL